MPKTVLLADDSLTIQRVVELTFAREDVNVVAVGDGDQAIAVLRSTPPDLVLADIGMPGRNGYEVVEFIRSEPRLSDLPVLLLAGAFEPVDQTQARRVGADGILTKPFDPTLLVERVNELLTSGRGAPVVAKPHPATVLAAELVAGPVAEPGSPSVLQEAVAKSDATAGEVPLREVEADRPRAASPEGRSTTPDEYFDQIDQAFAALSRAPRPAVPAEDLAHPVDGPAIDPSEVPSVSPPSARPSATVVPLPDAFAALLEAERTGSTEWPPFLAAAIAAPAPASIDLDALAERVARRVIEQLSDRIVRETVAEVVSRTAEQLVREEIERIRRNIT